MARLSARQTGLERQVGYASWSFRQTLSTWRNTSGVCQPCLHPVIDDATPIRL